MKDIIIGESLDGGQASWGRWCRPFKTANCSPRKSIRQADGDVRYWASPLHRARCFSVYRNSASVCFVGQTGARPVLSIIMINVIDAAKSPNGSGGGWHRE